MGFGDAVRTCWRKYGDFDGRAQRSEFWWWILFVTLLQIAASIVLTVLLIVFQNAGFLQWLGVLIFMIVVLAVILPSIAVSVRRLWSMRREAGSLTCGRRGSFCGSFCA